jgi:chromate reductase
MIRTEEEMMSMTIRVGVLVGSLRQASWTRKVAKQLVSLAPAELTFEWIEIGDLPHYNQDLEETPPASWLRFRQAIAACDAILFVTPEYNRSLPGVLKNAIDVGSRPAGQSVWKGKPAGVVSVAPRDLGGFGANHHLRQALVFLDMPTLQQPEAYVGRIAERMDEAGNITVEATRDFLQKFMQAFAGWVEKFGR